MKKIGQIVSVSCLLGHSTGVPCWPPEAFLPPPSDAGPVSRAACQMQRVAAQIAQERGGANPAAVLLTLVAGREDAHGTLPFLWQAQLAAVRGLSARCAAARPLCSAGDQNDASCRFRSFVVSHSACDRAGRWEADEPARVSVRCLAFLRQL